jgi:hypothetical protein
MSYFLVITKFANCSNLADPLMTKLPIGSLAWLTVSTNSVKNATAGWDDGSFGKPVGTAAA